MAAARRRPLADVPSPDRTLLARVGRERGGKLGLTVVSAALAPASSWGALKVEQCPGIVELLRRRRAPILLGIDANTPRTDHPDPARVDFWWPEEAQLLGDEAPHSLRDMYRTWREHHGSDQPMPISFEGNGPARRYDHVLASPEFAVRTVTTASTSGCGRSVTTPWSRPG